MDPETIAALKLAFTAASYWSEWCVIAVTVGVFIEFLALFIFSKEMPVPEKIVMGIATAVIVAGCAGEYIFGDRATVAASKLQDASDVEIVTAKREAAKASERAADTELKAANLQKENVEPELALAPRVINEPALRRALSDATRVPVFIPKNPTAPLSVGQRRWAAPGGTHAARCHVP